MSDTTSNPLVGNGVPPVPPHVVIPYVEGFLRTETHDAVAAYGGPYALRAIDEHDEQGYAKAFAEWWKVPGDLMVIEQDINPFPSMIRSMLKCAHDWCVRPYHVGNGQYTTGLGMCKISAALRADYPDAWQLITRHPTDHRRMIGWRSLNEAVERQLTRYHVTAHLHETPVAHLHYPENPRDR